MRTKLVRMCAIGACVFMLSGGASASIVYDNLDDWEGEISHLWNAAQTFVVPETKELATIETVVRSLNNASFRILVYEWDDASNHIVPDSLIFQSDFFIAPDVATSVEIEIGVTIQSGITHAFIVEWDNDGLGSGVAFLQSDGGASFPLGYATFSLNPFDVPWHFDSAGNYDVAFRAVFLPSSGAIALLTASLFLGGRPRRRDAPLDTR